MVRVAHLWGKEDSQIVTAICALMNAKYRNQCMEFAVSGLYRQVIPDDEALTQILYFTIQNVMKRWTMPLANWALAISQLAVMHKSRFDLKAI